MTLVDELEALLLSSRLGRARRSVRRSRSGRLDWRSAMRAERNPDDPRIFRKQETVRAGPGRLRVAVNLDVSRSMAPVHRRAVACAAAVSDAVERIGAASAIVAFGTRSLVVKGWDTALRQHVDSSASRLTDLAAALRADEALFAASDSEGAPAVVNVTDDELGSDRSFSRQWLATFRDAGGFSLALVHRPVGALALPRREAGEDVVARVREEADVPPAFGAFLAFVGTGGRP